MIHAAIAFSVNPRFQQQGRGLASTTRYALELCTIHCFSRLHGLVNQGKEVSSSVHIYTILTSTIFVSLLGWAVFHNWSALPLKSLSYEHRDWTLTFMLDWNAHRLAHGATERILCSSRCSLRPTHRTSWLWRESSTIFDCLWCTRLSYECWATFNVVQTVVSAHVNWGVPWDVCDTNDHMFTKGN